MGKLCVYIPPFASDYSGVCSCLFDLDCMTAINDASCCTSHYVFYDEPRWSKRIKPVFSTTLRTVDAILGNDQEVVDSIVVAANETQSDMVAVVGTPVPAITGMDTKGMAMEVENSTGKPSFGFDTCGFKYYDTGIISAGKALINRLAKKQDRIPGTVNIIGMTPLDYGDKGNAEALEAFLTQNGYAVNCRLFMGTDLEQITRCPAAEKNLAVSYAGLQICKFLQKKYGTPYVAGFPMGKILQEEYLHKLNGKLISSHTKTEEIGNSILIVGDQVMACSLRDALRQSDVTSPITVASFFGMDSDLMEEGDLQLKDELSYMRLLHSGRYSRIIADPLLENVPAAKNLHKTPLTHPAVSGYLGWEKVPDYLSLDISSLIQN